MVCIIPTPIHLEEKERSELEQLANKHTTPQQLALRARIILLLSEGGNHRRIARELKISRDMVRFWRHRWLDSAQRDKPARERLKDAERCGAPASFSPEQLTHLFAIACEDPLCSGAPHQSLDS